MIELNGRRIFFREFGDPGLPLLVLVHGLYGDTSTVAPLAERLAERFHVIAPDALGHGLSDHPAEFTLEDQGKMLDALVATLGHAAATVVGVSMGAYLAAEAAILEPSRVSHLVLVVGKAHGTTSSSAAYAARMGFDLAKANPEEALAFMSGAIWSPDTTPERRAEIVAMQSESQVVLTPDEKAAVELSLAGFDLRPELHRITAATFVISGRADGLNPPEAGEELARHIHGARFEVYEHSGHVLAFEEMDKLVTDIIGFVLDA
ncbi:3-oxoadipate enol-lactonase [soil metagenome]